MDKVYEILQLVGTSKNSIEEAIRNALAAAHEKGHKVDWFEVVENRGFVNDGQVQYHQVVLKLGCA